MREPMSDNITPADRESAVERRSARSIEREVRLEGSASPADVIRARVEEGFYQTPAVADIVARRLVERGEFRLS